EIKRGTLGELRDWARAESPRGEVAVVVGGAIGDERPVPPAEELARRARELMDTGVARKDALNQVAREAGVGKRRVFDALVEDGRDAD
ncbi:MAG TPA: 16S rRNA (cytidine(1402)-2'-O)-methyltransferase, partial [Actinomycetota bacterium]|nr:16S rRNA (cytidine(1402)-2'-O)-methyltransferase [Actinomycetota bacterium]